MKRALISVATVGILVPAAWIMEANAQQMAPPYPPSPGYGYQAPVVNLRPADFLDVYALLVSRPYDAIFDVLLALPPVPPELHALRLRLACSGRLF